MIYDLMYQMKLIFGARFYIDLKFTGKLQD